MVVALAALFVALSGVGYATIVLPANSVTTVQVKNFSLLARDFKAGQLKAGPAGATKVQVRTATAAVAAGAPGSVTASCAPGERATGGGYLSENVGSNDSYPVPSAGTPNAWKVTTKKGSPDNSSKLTVYVICAAP